MGKGDKKTKRGKIFKGSFGKTRPRKLKKSVTTPAATTPSDVLAEEPKKKGARKKQN